MLSAADSQASYIMNTRPTVIVAYTTKDRPSAEDEAQRLRDAMAIYELDVFGLGDFTRRNLLYTIRYAATSSPAIIVVIMGYADGISIYDRNSEALAIQEIIDVMCVAESKPKILIIQACLHGPTPWTNSGRDLPRQEFTILFSPVIGHRSRINSLIPSFAECLMNNDYEGGGIQQMILMSLHKMAEKGAEHLPSIKSNVVCYCGFALIRKPSWRTKAIPDMVSSGENRCGLSHTEFCQQHRILLDRMHAKYLKEIAKQGITASTSVSDVICAQSQSDPSAKKISELSIRLITWNTNCTRRFISEERLTRLMQIVGRLEPHAVMLQEVCEEYLDYMDRHGYTIHSELRSKGMYNVILLNKDVFKFERAEKVNTRFKPNGDPVPENDQIYVLIVTATHQNSAKFCFVNFHFNANKYDPIKDNAELRENCVKVVLKKLSEIHVDVIFMGGDTNFINDAEAKPLLNASYSDAAAVIQQSPENTHEPIINKLNMAVKALQLKKPPPEEPLTTRSEPPTRSDRIYYKAVSNWSVDVVDCKLVGKDEKTYFATNDLSMEVACSDHYGLSVLLHCRFNQPDGATSSRVKRSSELP